MRRTLNLEKRVQADMLAQHNTAMGCWGVPDGAAYTFSRAEFFDKAKRLGVVSEDEYNQIRAANSGIWHRDLSD